jgi:putative (di)nucleoside polyphosphate hydrolase
MPAEFDAWRWAPLAELPDLIVPFKRQAYLEVVAAFADLPGRLRAG